MKDACHLMSLRSTICDGLGVSLKLTALTLQSAVLALLVLRENRVLLVKR